MVHNDVSCFICALGWLRYKKGEQGGWKTARWFLLPLPCLGHTLLKMVSWIQDGYTLVTAGSSREIGKF